MSNLKTGGPAFPQPDSIDEGVLIATGHTGMTLRDYFAAKAMQSYASDPDWRADMDPKDTAFAAYQLADAMLRARMKE